ncbi:hypothetical protein [uncultured Psychrobacter sp.]|jgi:hypothetical protein|uniref:hypothetical protein n=1 Tax=uncultured Psychrobacter sp. TaxID=259303 RepID=UPI002617EC63|nr:hypothetical protein [uncultured Psychrobacter sp.]
MQKILLSIFMLVFSSNVFAAELWQGLESGASSQQIIKKFPSAKIDSNKSFPKEIDNRLVMKDYVLFKKDFTVRFLMKNNELKKVLLHTAYPKYDPVYAEAFRALSLKYGVPVENLSSPFGNSAKWFHNGTEISLLDTLDNDLFINYSTDLIDNASKL